MKTMNVHRVLGSCIKSYKTFALIGHCLRYIDPRQQRPSDRCQLDIDLTCVGSISNRHRSEVPCFLGWLTVFLIIGKHHASLKWYQWLSARLQYLQTISNGESTILLSIIVVCMKNLLDHQPKWSQELWFYVCLYQHITSLKANFPCLEKFFTRPQVPG